MRPLKAKKITQVLPAVRFMPKLPVSSALAAELSDIVENALAKNGMLVKEFEASGKDTFASVFAPVRAQRAAELYVSTKQYATSLPKFRKMVDRRIEGSLGAVTAQLLELLGDDNNPPFAQMRALFCSSDPQVDGFDQSTSEDREEDPIEGDDPAYDDDSGQPEGIWRTKHSPAVVKETLGHWLQLLDDLHQSLGRGRPRVHAEMDFVSRLAAYWVEELKLPPSSGRGEPKKKSLKGGKKSYDQQGPFADFVRKTVEIIPKRPAGLRPRNLDRAIRNTIQAYKKREG